MTRKLITGGIIAGSFVFQVAFFTIWVKALSRAVGVVGAFLSPDAPLPTLFPSFAALAYVSVSERANQSSTAITYAFSRNVPDLPFMALTESLPNGHMAYCSNCTNANPCTEGGTGALAVKFNETWTCK